MEQKTGVLVGVGIGLAIIVIFSVANWTVNSIQESRFRQAYHSADSAYREALSAVGQRSGDSQQRMSEFISAWEVLFNKYRLDAPPPFTSDDSWRESMTTMDGFVRDAESKFAEGKLDEAYTSLQKVGSSWYQVFDRNTASVIGFYLLQFRDIMDTSLSQAGVLDYARLDVSCGELGDAWRDVRNSPVYLPKERASVFDDYLWKEKMNIDSFCEAVAARDDANVRDSAVKIKQGFAEVYERYN